MGHLDLCRVLVDAGAPVGLGTAKRGGTPLMVASYRGYLEVVVVLLAHG
jgi:ankyrin repeat protein